ncbi:hypothetical protein Snoj_33930 [Streptomyces nojiriensis]|uniref:DUF4328 domain-containing protein n=1 Tax=Streptomyces nojiriensis TaxID=66374 RepID=A0ABQ3SMW6_9ACTN|nr:DUF4328 domain-containing protein [Streptomyces nojiriensis]QTI43041.1 hypothetical protein JYK04_00803 [Streptomyces nojiriensis]GGS30553.1 hypothetical protein GCM10010205_70840 [Streptomyces nojiriensis]GHI69475.1 hypothetical protein Snoj_33930 [Streptomyces nojiriensis]
MSVAPVGPPAPSPYAALDGKGARLRAPVGLAIALAALFALVIGIACYAVYADWNTRALMEGLLTDPAAVSDAELDRGARLTGLVGTIQGNALFVTGIVFIIWFHRVRTNAEVFAPGADKLAGGWAIGAWFVPLANFWLPYRIAVKTWGSSTPYGDDAGYRRFSLTLVNLWWGTFVLSRLLGWYGGMSYSRAQSPGAARDAATTMLVGDVLDIVAAVLAVLFVRRLTAMQQARAAQGPAAAAV